MKLTIIIPVYNEAENIRTAIESIEKEVKTNHSILIIYDFEKDTTIPAIKSLQKKIRNLHLVKNNFGSGRGVINAIKTGFLHINEGVVVVMMADLSDDSATIDKMYAKIIKGYDVVCASRYARGGGHVGGPFIKSLLSLFADKLAPFLLGVPTVDLTNAFKMYKKSVINAIKIESEGGFELSMEMTLKAYFKGFRLTEVPTVWHDRSAGKSRFKLAAWLPRYLYWYFWGIRERLKGVLHS